MSSHISIIFNGFYEYHNDAEHISCRTVLMVSPDCRIADENMSQSDRFCKLNQIAIHQMRLLTDDSGIKRLEGKDTSKGGF